MILEKILDNIVAVMKENAVGAEGYLNEAEEQLEFLPWFDLVTGADSSLRKKRNSRRIRTRHEETSVSKWNLHLSLIQLLKHYKK